MGRKVPIFYNALMLTGVNLLLRMVGTSFQVYLSSRIGAAGIGLLQLVLSVGAMAMTAGIAGIRTATMYLTAEELGKRRPGNVVWVLSGAFLYSLLCSGTVALLLYSLAPRIAGGWINDIRTTDAIRLLAAFLPITCLSGVMTGYFTAANRIGTLAAVEVAEQACSMICTVIALTLWADSDPARACQAVVFGSGAGAILTLFCLSILRCREKSLRSPRIPIARRLTAVAIPLALADDLKAGISTAENLMVPKRLALFRGTENPLALFGTVCGMVFPVLMFPAAILFGLTELLIPEMARCNAAGSQKRIHYLMHRSLRIALLYGTLCGGILLLAAPELCLSLYGSTQAGVYLRWFAPLAVMLYCDIVTDAMIKGLGQQKASVRYNIFTSALDVLFLYILLPRYGIAGYFASFLLTHVVNFILSLRRLMCITKQTISIRTTVCVIITAVISAGIASMAQLPLVRCFAYTLLLIFGLVLSGILGRNDIRWMKGLLRK
ncbi:MAG: polysaccharide biosynthesis C-terminal domain-containing protein [Oscillospiraceae bacterium]|nr:polysaccharide biosynthesis C-terminal domain-containing protein [Oscillospiraceae bacterium]